MISSPTVGVCIFKLHQDVLVFHSKNEPGGLGHSLDWYYPKGVSKRPGGLGHLLDSYKSPCVTKSVDKPVENVDSYKQFTFSWINGKENLSEDT